jgi:hypothetical protein
VAPDGFGRFAIHPAKPESPPRAVGSREENSPTVIVFGDAAMFDSPA